MKNPFRRTPKISAVETFYNTLAQTVPTLNKETNQMQMTVNREQLTAALTEKRNEIAAEAQEAVTLAETKLADAKEGGNSAAKFLTELSTYVEGLDANNVRISSYDTGVWEIRVGKTKGSKIPSYTGNERDTVPHREAALDNAQKYLAKVTAPYDAALSLLNMSEDVTIGINSGDYHGLLGGVGQGASKEMGMSYR